MGTPYLRLSPDAPSAYKKRRFQDFDLACKNNLALLYLHLPRIFHNNLIN
jgi:hypothetical protein